MVGAGGRTGPGRLEVQAADQALGVDLERHQHVRPGALGHHGGDEPAAPADADRDRRHAAELAQRLVDLVLAEPVEEAGVEVGPQLGGADRRMSRGEQPAGLGAGRVSGGQAAGLVVAEVVAEQAARADPARAHEITTAATWPGPTQKASRTCRSPAGPGIEPVIIAAAFGCAPIPAHACPVRIVLILAPP